MTAVYINVRKNVKQFKHEKWEAISKKAKYF